LATASRELGGGINTMALHVGRRTSTKCHRNIPSPLRESERATAALHVLTNSQLPS
jgi:hypothetical protein